MRKMMYKGIVFDNFVEDSDDDYSWVWVTICDSCKKKYKALLSNKYDDSGSGEAACDVYGCNNTNAGTYIDFDLNEIILEGDD